MKKILTLFIALILVAGIVSVAKSADIGTSTWGMATAHSRNRHVVQSSNGIIVVLYLGGSGSGLRAKKSTNFGSGWTNLAGGGGSTQIDSTTAAYSSICIDNNDNIYVVWTEGTVIIRFMKLIYSAGSWSKGTERTVVSTGDNANPFIIRESGGRIWVAYGYDDGIPAGVRATRSDNEFQSVGTSYTVYTDNYESDESFYPALTIRPVNDYPFLVFSDRMSDLRWSSWNGSSWSGAVTVSSNFCGWGDLSSTMIGSDVHVVGIYGDYMKHTYYNGSIWSSPVTIRTAGSDSDASPSLTTDDVNLWCFAAIYYEDRESADDRYDIMYRKRTGSTWVGSWIAITNTHMDNHPVTPSISRQKIPLAWSRGLNSPYTVKFDYSLIIDITAPDAPINVTATPPSWTSDDSFSVDWTNPSDPSGIAGAYYKLNSVPGSDTDGTWTTSKPINNITVGTDGAHPIYIWLKDKSYNVDYQNRDSDILYLDATAPGAPTSVNDGVSGWSTDDTPTFTWNSPGDTSGIDGYWWRVNDTTPETGGTWTTLTTATTASLDDGTHTFYVKAQNGSGLIGPYGSHVCQIDDTPPGTPQNVDDGVSGSSNDNTPTFTWDSVTDTSGVLGYWCAVNDNTPESGGTWTTTLSSTTAPLSDGTHTFYVKAQNGSGLVSVSPGSHGCVIDTTAPAAITDLTGQYSTGDVILTWSTPGDDDWSNTLPTGSGYRIDYSSVTKSWDKDVFEVWIPTNGVTPHTEVSHTVASLQDGTTWYFQIWTRDEVPNWSGLSNGATVWIPSPFQTYTWTEGGAPGDWDDPNNWSGAAGYPNAATDKAIINLGSESINTGEVLIIGELELGSSYSGTLTLGGNFTLDSSGPWNGNLTISNANATLDLIGYNLTIPGTFSNNGTLKLRGGQTLSFTNDTNSGTVEYVGNGDAVVDTYTIKNFGANDYYNLTINSSGAADDVFQLGANLAMDGTLIVTSGVLYLNGNDITNMGSAVRGNIADTIRLYGNESVFWTTNDTNSGTYEYVGDGDAPHADIYIIKVFLGTDYYHLTINSTDGTTDTFRLPTANLAVAGNFTLTAGTFTTNDGTTDRNLTVAGNVDIDSTFNANSSTITVSGNWDSSGGTFNYGTSTVDLTGTGTVTDTGVYNKPFYNLTCAYPGEITTITTWIGVYGILSVKGGTLTTSGSRKVFLHKPSSTPISIVDGSTISVYRLQFRNTQTVPEYNYGSTLTVWNTGTVTQLGDVTCTGLMVDGDNFADRSPTWNTAGYSLTINGGLLVGGTGGSPTGTHTFTANGSTITVSGNVTLQHPNAYLNLNTSNMSVAGNWTITNGNVVPGTSTVTFDSNDTGKTITSNSQSFASVVFDSGDGTGGWILQDALTSSSLQIVDGTLTDNGQIVTVNGNITIANTSDILTSTGLWIQGADGNISNQGPNWYNNQFDVLQIDDNVTSTRTNVVHARKLVLGSTATLTATQSNYSIALDFPSDNDFIDMGTGSSITVGSISILLPVGSPKTQKAINTSVPVGIWWTNNADIQMTGNWTTGNLTIFGAAISQSEGDATLLDTNGYNLTVIGSLTLGRDTGTGYYGKIIFSTGTHTITGNVRVGPNNGGTHGYFDLGSADISIGNYVDFSSATVTPGTSTVTLNGAATQNVTSDGESFYHLEIENTVPGGASVQLQDAADIDGGLIVTIGGLVLNSYDITISSDVSISGSGLLTCSSGEQITVGRNWSASSGATFSAASSTTTFNGSGSFNILSSGTTFYNLAFSNSVSTWTLSDALYSAGDFTITNSSGNVNSNDKNLTIAGDFAVNGGNFKAGASAITVGGDWDTSVSAYAFTYDTSTVDLTGTGNLKVAVASPYFYNLTCAAADKTTTLQYSIYILNTLTLGGATGTLTDGDGSSYVVVLDKNSGTPLINGGATVTLNAINYFVTNGTITVAGGTYEINYLILQADSSNVTYNLGGDITVNGAFWPMAENGATNVVHNTQDNDITAGYLAFGADTSNGSTTFNVGISTIDIGIGGLLVLNAGGSHTLNLSSATVTCEGNWQLVTGTGTITQIPGTSTVTFDNASSTSTLTGSTTFYVLISTATGKNVKFTSDIVIGVTNHLNFENITLQSTSSGATWYLNLNPSATQDVFNVDVKDSNASGGQTIIALASTDSGNNTNWLFDDSIITWDGSESTNWNTAANWNLNMVPLSTQTVIIPSVATNDPQLNSNVTISSITIQTGGELSLNNYDISVSSDIYISGSLLCSNTEQITIGGNWSAYSGATVTASSSTVTFNGSGSFNILSSGTTFYNLLFNNNGGTWTLTDALYVKNDFTQLNGTFDTNSSGNYPVTIGDDITISGGTFYARVSTITLTGSNSAGSANWDSDGGTFTWGTSTVDLKETGTVTVTSSFSGPFYNLTCAYTDKTTTLTAGGTGIRGILTVQGGTLTGSGKHVYFHKASCTPISIVNDSTISVGSLRFDGPQNVPGYDYDTTLRLWNTGTVTQLGNVTCQWLRVDGDGFASRSPTWDTAGHSLTINGGLAVGGAIPNTGTHTFNANGSTITVTGSVTLNHPDAAKAILNLNTSNMSVAGNWTITNGTVNPGTSTVTFYNATSTSTLTGSTTFYVLISTATGKNVKFTSDIVIGVTNHLNFENITLRSTSGGATWYLNLSGTQDVSNVDVRDSNASGGDTIVAFGTNTDSGNNTNWDFAPPAAITDLTGLCDSDTGDVTLSWSTPGDDEWTGVLSSTSEYRIDYSTDSSRQWDKDTYEVSIPTYGVTPYTEVSHTITGLTGDSTWYFRIWTADEIPRWSSLSNGATVWVNPILSVSISTNAYDFGDVPMGQSTHTVSVITVTNEGNVNETYSLKISSVTLYDDSPSLWKSTNTTTGHNRFIFYAIFHAVPVSTSNFDSDDYVIDENRASTVDWFSDNDGGGDKQTGINVPKGDDRKLWFRLDMPTSTTTGKEEKITVTITAGPE